MRKLLSAIAPPDQIRVKRTAKIWTVLKASEELDSFANVNIPLIMATGSAIIFGLVFLIFSALPNKLGFHSPIYQRWKKIESAGIRVGLLLSNKCFH
jgi:hypothetical protein